MTKEYARVSVRRWQEFERLKETLAASLADLGGIKGFVRPGDSVVIKPNLTADAPSSSGGTTHVELVEALIEALRPGAPGPIVVAEGTGRFGPEHATAFLTGGWREMAERQQVELFNLDAGPHTEVTLDDPVYPGSLPFSDLIRDADVFITVPCLKTHVNCDYTIALKNAFGQIPQWKRSDIHREGRLEEAQVDINRIRKPDLVVVDGWDGAKGVAGGVGFDKPAGARLLMVGDDPVAVDVIGKDLMMMEMPTRYLNWAAKRGVGIADRQRIKLYGDPLADLRKRFMTPMEEVLEALPEVTVRDVGACSGCRSAVLSGLWRFHRQRLLRPVEIVMGNGTPFEAPSMPDVLFVGNCAERHAGADHKHVAGCPVSSSDVVQALDDMGVVCHQCRDLVQPLIEALDDEARRFLRVTAAGSQVFAGESVVRGEWHLELLVGDCVERYADAVVERATQFGLDPEQDIAFVRGCPPDVTPVREALERLVARASEKAPA